MGLEVCMGGGREESSIDMFHEYVVDAITNLLYVVELQVRISQIHDEIW